MGRIVEWVVIVRERQGIVRVRDASVAGKSDGLGWVGEDEGEVEGPGGEAAAYNPYSDGFG